MSSLENKILHPENWVHLYGDYLYHFALRHLSDPDLCKDMVQETLLAAIQAKDSFKGNSNERTWLTSILKNKIYDVYRKKKQTLTANDDYHFDKVNNPYFFEEETGHWGKESPKEWPSSHEDTFQRNEFSKIFNQCLEKLSRNAQHVVTMKFLDECPSEDICKELALSSSNYWVIMHRAKLQLRDCLEKKWFN